VVREATGEVAAAMRRLLPQLSASAAPPDQAAVQRIVSSEAITLLAARLDGQIVGLLTLAMFPIPTGFRAWIEDVIVDEAARGQGIGEALTKMALDLAARKVNVWSGHNYAWELTGVLGIRDAGSAVRAGLVHYNDRSDVDRLISAVAELAG